jgi:N-acyl amino acid synthase of PEP-CTERM/exosortase system
MTFLDTAFPTTRFDRPRAAPVSVPYRPRVRFLHVTRSDSLLDQIFALRYQIYCTERGFLNPLDYPHGLEYDEFDETSAHFCAVNDEGRVIGAVRLVSAEQVHEFPFWRYCRSLYSDFALPDATFSAEISRLVVDRRYCRRAGDAPPAPAADGLVAPATEYGIGSKLDRRAGDPPIVLGLYRAMYRYSRQRGIAHWYAAMESCLARALGRFSFQFQQVGPHVDYFGPVAPYLASLRDLERRVGAKDPTFLRWFQGD